MDVFYLKGTQISLDSQKIIYFTAQAKTRYAQTLARFIRKINNFLGAIKREKE